MEAGGIEPPSEGGFGKATTCLVRSYNWVSMSERTSHRNPCPF